MHPITGVVVAALVLSSCGSRPPAPAGGAVPGIVNIPGGDSARATEDKRTAHVTFTDEGSGKQPVEGSGDVRFGAEAAMELTVNHPERGSGTIRLVNGIFYLKAGSDPWQRRPQDRASSSYKAQQFEAISEPALYLRQIEAAGEVLREERTGSETRRSVRIDAARLAAAPGFASTGRELLHDGFTTFMIEVWTGPDSVISRVTIRMPCGNPDGGCENTLTIQYSDWGKPVTITEPPPSEVIEEAR